MRTYTPKPDEATRTWHLIDAEGKVLGRLAVEIASILRGKHKPTFSYHVDVGDHVVVVNAAKIAVTANKGQQKRYYRHSGYPGGLKSTTLADELERRPEEVLRRAVKGMLPRNRLGRQMLRKLKIYSGPEHPHEAQFKGVPGPPNSNTARKEAKARLKARHKAKPKQAPKPAAADETQGPEPAEEPAEEVVQAAEPVETDEAAAAEAEEAPAAVTTDEDDAGAGSEETEETDQA